MTKYSEREEPDAKFEIAWRMSWKKAVECKDCEHGHWVEGESRIAYACFHPQAQGKGGGWLLKCPEDAVIVQEDSD